ncbi:iron complex transport system ATP-binding protein [Sinobacterium caligoides]|uniref:Iron complex transport system ATP-binding protein n=1 Tax=Sinobacterium caligoides TaxID=933926 RepID=A0A3N2DYH3_9GAMM|nr:ABC transporter ATP-binding protein [Sinobacterium caligoides]ROS04834.1 iron complex transport system ATP-binding protein [Sinobacterium caligoides]
MVDGLGLKAENLVWPQQEGAVVKGISLALEEGEMLGIIGPNGAGKSSLVKLLAGVNQPAHGSVTLGGRISTEYGRREWARHLGYLAQNAPVAWPVTVERVVTLGRLPHQSIHSRLSDKDRQAVLWAMQAANVTALRHRVADQLSGGEQVRVMLARLLAGEPAIILADEPVAALDPAHQLEIMQLLANHARDVGPVAVVLHDLNLALRYCKRLALVVEGRLLMVAETKEVLTSSVLADAYQLDISLLDTKAGEVVICHQRVAR